MSITLITVLMQLMSIMSVDSHERLRQTFVFNHRDTHVFCFQLDPSTQPGKDSLGFMLISGTLAYDKV